jgi:1-acyl-sn-glycerol-3-phosphate acyltransferase
MRSDRGRASPHLGTRFRESIATLLRTAVALIVLPAGLLFISSAVFVGALRGASAPSLHPLYLRFARLCIRVGRTRLEVHGREHIQTGQAYVLVANHESAWDPSCITAGLPALIIRFIVKKPLMSIPIFGHALRRSGNVTVFRTQTAGDVERIRDAFERRDPNVSLLFFAEGTRSRDGALRAFKMGAFASALTYGLPVLPVAMAGTYAIWPKGTLRLRRGTVVLEVGRPIPTDGLKFEDRARLRDQAHEAFARLRARARQRLRAQGEDPGGVD